MSQQALDALTHITADLKSRSVQPSRSEVGRGHGLVEHANSGGSSNDEVRRKAALELRELVNVTSRGELHNMHTFKQPR